MTYGQHLFTVSNGHEDYWSSLSIYAYEDGTFRLFADKFDSADVAITLPQLKDMIEALSNFVEELEANASPENHD